MLEKSVIKKPVLWHGKKVIYPEQLNVSTKEKNQIVLEIAIEGFKL